MANSAPGKSRNGSSPDVPCLSQLMRCSPPLSAVGFSGHIFVSDARVAGLCGMWERVSMLNSCRCILGCTAPPAQPMRTPVSL